ncbi:MAG: hypothetical protein CMJ18_00385 [Phycisphaeraceae bacterium]|nr:hypothetical protein [Phycisphaeraceae bacterium]
MNRTSLICIVASITVLSTWALVRSAPEMNTGRASDITLSLARIDRIGLLVADMPETLTDTGITNDQIIENWTGRLAKIGIEVVAPDRKVPVLELRILSGTPPQLSDDVVLTTVTLTLRQPATIERVERTLIVPTYVHPVSQISKRDVLAASTARTLDNQMGRFLSNVRVANLVIPPKSRRAP